MGLLWGHPHEAQLLSYLKDGVSAFKSRTEEYRGTAFESYWCDAFAGASFPNGIPKDHTEFVRSEVAALLGMSGQVRRRPGPDRSSTI